VWNNDTEDVRRRRNAYAYIKDVRWASWSAQRDAKNMELVQAKFSLWLFKKHGMKAQGEMEL
jgi:hypothetical protein